MKIAELIPQFYPYIGGAEIGVHNIAKGLAAKKHDVVVVTTTSEPQRSINDNYSIEYLWNYTCPLLFKFPFMGRIYLNRRLFKLQNRYDFDVWHITSGIPLGVYAVDYLKSLGVPVVLECCGDDIQVLPEMGYGYRLDPLLDAMVKANYPKFDKLIAKTASIADEYEALGIPKEKIVEIPNGVNIGLFDFTERVKYNARRSYVKILTVGRNVPGKGLDIIPEIAEILTSMGVDYRWTIAGRGVEDMKEMLPDGIRGNFKLIGSFDDEKTETFELPSKKLVELYLTSDIFVFPSLMESFGMVVVESLAAGLPVVASDIPGVRDVLRNEPAGRLIESRSPKSYAEALFELIDNPEDLVELGKSARRAAEKYDWEKVISRYEELFLNT